MAQSRTSKLADIQAFAKGHVAQLGQLKKSSHGSGAPTDPCLESGRQLSPQAGERCGGMEEGEQFGRLA